MANGDLETGIDGNVVRALHHEVARGGGTSAGCHQPGGGDPVEISNVVLSHRELAACISREYGRLQQHVEDDRPNMSQYATIRASWARQAARLIVAHGPPIPGTRVAIARADSSIRTEVLGGRAAVYIPRSIWKDVRDRTVAMMDDMRMGDIATSGICRSGDR